MSNAALILNDCRLFETASAGAYAAGAKQSIVKIIRPVQSFLSVPPRRKSMGDECQRIDGPLRTPSLLILDGAVSALESLIIRSIDRV
jgi:hypothetical protein